MGELAVGERCELFKAPETRRADSTTDGRDQTTARAGDEALGLVFDDPGSHEMYRSRTHTWTGLWCAFGNRASGGGGTQAGQT